MADRIQETRRPFIVHIRAVCDSSTTEHVLHTVRIAIDCHGPL